MENIDFINNLVERFSKIGIDPLGGVTRLGYTKVEDEMHKLFVEIGKEEGFLHKIDQVGNTFIGDITSKNYILIGSHLDSVNQGGIYDGVSGIIGGLQVLKWIKKNNIDIPIQIVAFRCEESSNFSKATMGSEFITGITTPQSMKDHVSQDKETLSDIFIEKGYSFNPHIIKGVNQYLELHIEQSIVLEKERLQIGIVSTIAGPRRYSLKIFGQADHSGGTPMFMRKDALAAASEIILAVEKTGQIESVFHTVATVGVINNLPNVMNVIPGNVEIKVDIRGVDEDSLDRTVKEFYDQVELIIKKRGLKKEIISLSASPPVKMSREIQKQLQKVADELGYPNKIIPSGAGHDAMNFLDISPMGMVFIPCKNGISHSKEEYTSAKDIYRGAKVIYEYVKRRGLL